MNLREEIKSFLESDCNVHDLIQILEHLGKEFENEELIAEIMNYDMSKILEILEALGLDACIFEELNAE